MADRTIHDYWGHGTLRLTLAGVIAKSSNVGTVLASRQLGHRLPREIAGGVWQWTRFSRERPRS